LSPIASPSSSSATSSSAFCCGYISPMASPFGSFVWFASVYLSQAGCSWSSIH
jgi:hypothetical protein